ncbi:MULTISPECIES: hypothetical protein [Streptomyces]|uniref:hypothetical protein n=1 Tax=Streptomyces TaxID=1883 RepID=UPI0029ADD439|nr:hypothetical protein [Streptomyces europaeiscabiei]MDX3715772.1 hypothetical protein [Streptomyces europaeiscabiei]WSG19988.1 hypothetical protein OHB30_02255 [Streptomyces europaeiscabiei]
MLQASARPHPRISHTTDYRQHHTHISKFSKHHPNEPRSVIHGTAISFDRIVAAPSDRLDATTWLRAIMLEDGTRLLAATGQWTKAAAHAALYDDASAHLREARQTQVIESLYSGRTDSARAALETSVITEPWERAVAACLRNCIDLHINQLTPAGVAQTLRLVRHAQQSSEPDTAYFRLRLALTE